MTSDPFAKLSRELETGTVASMLTALADQLRSEGRLHELFDALLIAARHRLGLDPAAATPIDHLPEPLRTQVEEAYLTACREVGRQLLAQGKLREAWMYLKPAGEQGFVARSLEGVEPSDENLQELIELSLYEGVAPVLGYRLVLDNYGTCNAITAMDGVIAGRSRAEQQAAAGLLLARVHGELVENVRADIVRRGGDPGQSVRLAELLAGREDLFADNNYHLDTTHLHATVRFARLCVEPAALELAWDLTEYGRRLSSQFAFAGEEPFIDFYPASGLFFAAQLGRQVDEALAHFRRRADEAGLADHGPAPAETYVALLDRIGRTAEAAQEAARLLPPGTRTTGFAPPLLDLCRRAERFDCLLSACESSRDLVGYAVGLAARRGKQD